ncbi:MAG: sulfatase [FCB group bacterium]|jgi:arylsulfatase A-like enzyme|nr:sulfatase [FCB group bacterium]
MAECAHSGLTRRQFLGAVAVSAALTGAGGAAGESQARRPNVLYVFSDQHRWHSMSFTEQPEVQTPHMARMAREGVSFSQCISSYPVCSPHRAMLITGRWPYQTGLIDNNIKLSPNEPTVSKAFKEAGYRTGYIGKWHLGGERAEPFGFDHSLIWTGTNEHWDQSKYYPAEGDPVQPKGYNATLMTDQALAFMEEQRSEPFFLMLSLNPPHSNFVDAPESKKALYPKGSIPFRANVPEAPAEADEAVMKHRLSGVNRSDWETYLGYHAHISAIDDELGRILNKLDELGLADNTVVVYSSDHGSMQGSHGLGGKRQPHEESIRVPFLVRYPGAVPAGRQEDALMGSVDIAPTLTGLAGLDKPAAFEGCDFSPLLRGEAFEKPSSQLIMHIAKDNATGGQNNPAPLFRGLRTDRYTYAELTAGGGLLFDNREDPYQLKNLFAEPALDKERTALHEELIQSLRRAHDPLGNA